MTGVILMGGQEASRQLNRLARERMKQRLLNDILVDLQVCELEGWNKLEYIAELRDMLDTLGVKKCLDIAKANTTTARRQSTA